MGTIGTIVRLVILDDRQPLSSTVASNCVPRGAALAVIIIRPTYIQELGIIVGVYRFCKRIND
jgi:hypothetical protein